jgi:hypothetical protein
MHRRTRAALVLLAFGAAVACGHQSMVSLPPGSTLPIGTWGGDNAGVIVDDTIAHVHVGCTFGNAAAPIALDAAGRFSVTGSYVLRAYPITIGPSVPARFDGVVSGHTLTLTVSVDDTVAHRTVVLGPVGVTLGTEPRMGVCPICRRPRATP